MPKLRLDRALLKQGLAVNRSQAEDYIRLGFVRVNDQIIDKPNILVPSSAKLTLSVEANYVSRGAYKLDSVVHLLRLSFKDLVVLDVGSSVGGFTDYVLKHGASRVIAVDVGTNQLHPRLRADKRVLLAEQTDIRELKSLPAVPDVVLIDVSFISLRRILPSVAKLCQPQTIIIALVKPQFETTIDNLKHDGIIKNDHIRRDILKDFEQWARKSFVIIDKADSAVAGAKGNLERFYVLKCRQIATTPTSRKVKG
jgi:23S rRNA (cytidine1920-2'-O)/16S rRNA (cytidine1409-2'-O)-methyltransferase